MTQQKSLSRNLFSLSRSRHLALGAASLAMACLTGCGSTGRNSGSTFECQGAVIDNTNGQLIKLICADPSCQAHIRVCALPTDSNSTINSFCKNKCEQDPSIVGFGPGISRRCEISGTSVVSTDCRPGSVVFYNHSPGQATMQISSNTSIAQFSMGSQSATTSVSGTVDLDIAPNSCTGPTCALRIHRILLAANSFAIGGNSVTNITVQNRGYVDGMWNANGTVEIPAGALEVTVNFDVGSDHKSTTLLNNQIIIGTLNRDYTNFSLPSLTFSQPDGTLTLSLLGAPIGRPPTAIITSPAATVQCDSPGAAHVSFSSAGSSDPDNDIAHRYWIVDGQSVASDVVDYSTVLALGQHTVTLSVIDSRGSESITSKTINVADTQAPQVALTASPSCLWPPNHKYALYELGRDFTAVVTDACDPTASARITGVNSNQAPLVNGSGQTIPDYAYGSGAFCIRSERTGTVNDDRIYTVTVEVKDASGNTATKTIPVTVPHNGPGKDCNIDTSRIVTDDDPRCIAAAQEPSISQTSRAATGSAASSPMNQSLSNGGCSTTGSSSTSSSSVAFLSLGAAWLFLTRRRMVRAVKKVLPALALLVVGCSSASSSIPESPVMGTVGQMAFSVNGQRANWSTDRTRLTVTLVGYPLSCSSSLPTPSAGQTLVDIAVTIPSEKVAPGTYAVQTSYISGSTDVGIVVTRRTSGPSGPTQSSSAIQSGNIVIKAVNEGTITGGFEISQADIQLSGMFSASICP